MTGEALKLRKRGVEKRRRYLYQIQTDARFALCALSGTRDRVGSEFGPRAALIQNVAVSNHDRNLR